MLNAVLSEEVSMHVCVRGMCVCVLNLARFLQRSTITTNIQHEKATVTYLHPAIHFPHNEAWAAEEEISVRHVQEASFCTPRPSFEAEQVVEGVDGSREAGDGEVRDECRAVGGGDDDAQDPPPPHHDLHHTKVMSQLLPCCYCCCCCC